MHKMGGGGGREGQTVFDLSHSLDLLKKLVPHYEAYLGEVLWKKSFWKKKIPLFMFCSIKVLWRDIGLKSPGLPISHFV